MTPVRAPICSGHVDLVEHYMGKTPVRALCICSGRVQIWWSLQESCKSTYPCADLVHYMGKTPVKHLHTQWPLQICRVLLQESYPCNAPPNGHDLVGITDSSAMHSSGSYRSLNMGKTPVMHSAYLQWPRRFALTWVRLL